MIRRTPMVYGGEAATYRLRAGGVFDKYRARVLELVGIGMSRGVACEKAQCEFLPQCPPATDASVMAQRVRNRARKKLSAREEFYRVSVSDVRGAVLWVATHIDRTGIKRKFQAPNALAYNLLMECRENSDTRKELFRVLMTKAMPTLKAVEKAAEEGVEDRVRDTELEQRLVGMGKARSAAGDIKKI